MTDMELFMEVARAIHKTLDLGEVFKTLVRLLKRRIKFKRASILLLSEDGSTLRFREIEPPGREVLGLDSAVPLQGSAAGEAIRTAKPVVTRDLRKEVRYYEDPFLLGDGVRSRACVPLFTRGRPVGTLNLADDRPGVFTEKQVELLTRLAEQISVAVANSEAYRQVRLLQERLEFENTQLRQAMASDPSAAQMIGESRAWKDVQRQIELVAPTDSTVLLRGETGTGKELVARAIHRRSLRASKPFVAVNGAALSAELAASELFGHEKGAFTGALHRKLGRVELADGGTLFLDEIGDLPAELQVRLLRFLQEREFERVGGVQTVKADVRVVAATNRDLERLRSEGRFRDDLFFRINVFPILLPPLRERVEDVGPLLAYFMSRLSQKLGKKFRHIDRQTLLRCQEYPWPGNVRELENVVERSVILCPEPVFSMNPQAQAESSAPGSSSTSLHAIVRAHILRALKLCKGKVYGLDGAARLLGLKPSTLQARIKKLGIRSKALN